MALHPWLMLLAMMMILIITKISLGTEVTHPTIEKVY
jgi:hypothetical protein